MPDPLVFEAAGSQFVHFTTIVVTRAANVWHIELNREAKRNALSDAMVGELHACIALMQADVGAIILSGKGKHFCAGLDLSELKDHGVAGGMRHSQMWHAAFDQVQFGPAPVIAVLQGAVVGGGLELASSAHVRIAEPNAFFALPEGQRGLFVGGGGSVRIPRLIGVSRMTDMMLTGRSFDALQAEQIGLVNYAVDAGAGITKACELAQKIAGNAPLSNFAVMNALPRIAEVSPAQGLFTESLMAAIAQSDGDAKARMASFLEGKAAKVKPSDGG